MGRRASLRECQGIALLNLPRSRAKIGEFIASLREGIRRRIDAPHGMQGYSRRPLRKFAAALGIPVADLFTEEKKRKK